MRVEPITSETLDVVLTWWEARGDGVPPIDVLPAIGRVSVNTWGRPLAAAFLYVSPGCRVAILDWLVTRPGLGPSSSRAACLALLRDLEGVARESDATTLFASVSRAAMAAEAQAAGFHIAAEGCIHLVKPL